MWISSFRKILSSPWRRLGGCKRNWTNMTFSLLSLWTFLSSFRRKSHLARKSGKQPEERQLFHGTDASTAEAISQQGFDWRMCGKHGTRYGKGTYFACRANYSHRYTQQGSGRKMMFLARVLVGSFTNGDREMTRPPAKDPLHPHVLYDSCCDNSSNPALFVIFENGQSYPEFLITYSWANKVILGVLLVLFS